MWRVKMICWYVELATLNLGLASENLYTIYVRYYEHVYKTKRGNFHSKVNGELSQENHRLHAQVKRDSADIY